MCWLYSHRWCISNNCSHCCDEADSHWINIIFYHCFKNDRSHDVDSTNPGGDFFADRINGFTSELVAAEVDLKLPEQCFDSPSLQVQLGYVIERICLDCFRQVRRIMSLRYCPAMAETGQYPIYFQPVRGALRSNKVTTTAPCVVPSIRCNSSPDTIEMNVA